MCELLEWGMWKEGYYGKEGLHKILPIRRKTKKKKKSEKKLKYNE